jgi:hypothetical protein
VKFDNWWDKHQNLFTEPVVKVLGDINLRQSEDSLIIEDYQLFHTLILKLGYDKEWTEYVEYLYQNKHVLELNKIHIH